MKKALKKFFIASVAAGTFIFNPPANDLSITPTVYAEEKKLNFFDELPIFDSAKDIAKSTDLDSEETFKKLQDSFTNATPLERQILNTFFDCETLLKFFSLIEKDPFKIYSTEDFNNALNGIEESKKIAQKILAFKMLVDGFQLERQGNLIAAETAFNQAVSIDPNYTPTYCLRGFAYMIMANDKTNPVKSAEFFNKSMADFNKAVEINPTAPLSYISRSFAYISCDKKDEAASDINKIVEMFPEDYLAYMIRGSFLNMMEKPEAAVEDYTKAIELKAINKGVILDFDDVYKARGDVYIKLAQYDNAIADYSKIVELKPDKADSYYDRGKIYVQTKNYKKAIADFDKAIEMDPENIKFYMTRGNCYQTMGEKKKAKADFAKVKKLEDKIRKDFNKRKKS